MIKILRFQEPRVLKRNGEKWKKELSNAKTDADKSKARGKYKHTEIKQTLKIMCNEKCAYCESQLSHIAYGHIEHFRPYSKYANLCFEWTNLLLSCEICNGKRFKSDKFPFTLVNEPMIDPSLDDPNDHFEFLIDPATNLCFVVNTTPRGEITEECLGLNRDDLVNYRSSYIKKLIVLKKFADQKNAEALQILNEALNQNQPYLAFAKKLRP